MNVENILFLLGSDSLDGLDSFLSGTGRSIVVMPLMPNISNTSLKHSCMQCVSCARLTSRIRDGDELKKFLVIFNEGHFCNFKNGRGHSCNYY